MSFGPLLLGLALLFVFLMLNGLFVAFEFAIIALRKSRIEELVQKGHTGAKRVQAMHQRMDKTIAGAQLGITLASLALGWLGDHSILPLIKSAMSAIPGVADANLPVGLGVFLSFVVLSTLHVVVGEQVPKTMALRASERMAFLLAGPFRAFCFVTAPLVWVMNGLTWLLLKPFGMTKARHDEHQLPSPAEFQILFEESVKAGTLGKQESDFLKRALELKAVTLKEVMVPRTRMDCLEERMGLVDMMAVASRTKHSKLPVYRNTRDNVIGILNTRDLHDLFYAHLKVRAQAGDATAAGAVASALGVGSSDAGVQNLPGTPPGVRDLSGATKAPRLFRLTEYVRKAYFVPDTMLASTLLEQMKERKLQMAVVLDEFGATVGIVTLEDLLEQLVGEIWDEYDSPGAGIEQEDETTWHVPGDLTIFEFNKFFGAALSCETHCVTVAGLVIEALDRQPDGGETVELQGYRFTILEIKNRAVFRLAVQLPQDAPPLVHPADGPGA
ncbi:MAG: HlyC/CorC family transporter [Candidatus Melainabacteria bacterium]|nr:HlyC/CorC family transporter [Candidatus Melainabacteria bacterium]